MNCADRRPVGRPLVGDVSLPQLIVPNELYNNLKKIAGIMGIALPELRRLCYKEFLDTEQNRFYIKLKRGEMK
jgi:hypothetical protein